MSKRITVLSGKGGVGKSMVASSLAILFSKDESVLAIDCDVDAPNLALWLGIDTSREDNFSRRKWISTTEKPIINKEICIKCKNCIRNCNFNALEWDDEQGVKLISHRCEGCGLCEIICPSIAVRMKKVNNCLLTEYISRWGFPVFQGQIKPGEAESGEAVTEIRKLTKGIEENSKIIIQDAAAGIGCPVIASITGSDYVILVSEPSKSSFSDMKRALSVVKHFKIPYGVVINKYDLNEKISDEIKSFSKKNYLGGISYDKDIVNCIVELKPVVESNIEPKKQLIKIYKKTENIINSL